MVNFVSASNSSITKLHNLVMPLTFLQAVDGAHSQGNTINSLATFSSPMMPLLVSGCKGGFLKLWNPETCSNIGMYSIGTHNDDQKDMT